MRKVYGLCFFYKKLIIPSLAISVLLSFFSMKYIDIFTGIGISYIFLTPAFHYFTYEMKNPNEYYFYYNLGLSKLALWISTITLSLVIGLLFATI